MKSILKRIELWWKNKIKDHVIVIKSITSVSAYVLIIDFTSDDVPYYLTIHGDYKVIRTKYLSKVQEEKAQEKPPISFDDFMEEINLLVPAKDVVLELKKDWICKF